MHNAKCDALTFSFMLYDFLNYYFIVCVVYYEFVLVLSFFLYA